MNAAEAIVARLLSERLGKAGKVLSISLDKGEANLKLELRGQPTTVELFAEGLRWEPHEGYIILRWDRAGSSLEWADVLLREASERSGRSLRLTDGLRLLPLKALLPRS
jgi:hypothetical protein